MEVLKGLSFAARAGETVAVTGASGSGKSTLLHVLGGLDTADAGSVRVGGEELTRLSATELGRFRQSHVGFVFQFHHLLPGLSAWENVALPLLIARRSQGEARAAALELLSAVDLRGRAEHSPGELSGGEQQRVAVARALANRPPLVLADEPTGNLDEATSDRVFAEFLGLVRGEGSAALVATHNERLAARMDRVVRLHEGHFE